MNLKAINGVLIPDVARLSSVIGEIIKGRAGMPLYLFLAGLVAGFYAIAAIFISGHAHTINTSNLVPWGLQITTYIYFVLISTGCTFINFFGQVFYKEQYKPFASRVIFLGIMTAVAAFFSLATEMGRIDRMYNFVLSPNPKSPMFWMGVWYTCYLVAIIWEYINIQKDRHSDKVMWGAFIIAIITHSTLGSLLGAVSSRAYYYSALLPIYFLFIAFLTGGALTAIVAALTVRQKGLDGDFHLNPFVKFLRIGLGLALLTGFWRTMIGLAGHVDGSEVFKLTALNNIAFGLGVAVIIPYILLRISKSAGWLAFVGLFIMVTQLKTRSDLVIGGFKVPVFRAYDVPEVIHYTPSIYEILVLVASVSLVAVLYLLCEKSGLFEVAGKEVN
jgi:molybdopterin-containing oxidoreductase family membrane subunit